MDSYPVHPEVDSTVNMWVLPSGLHLGLLASSNVKQYACAVSCSGLKCFRSNKTPVSVVKFSYLLMPCQNLES